MHGETTPVGAVELWQHIFGDERGLLAICHSDGQAFKTTFFNYPDSAQQAAEFSHEKAQAGRNVWFCCHLLTTPQRLKENATAVRTLWGDLDGAEVPNGGLSPTAVVQSSPGRFHCYWRLTDPIPPEAAESLNKRVARVIGADSSGFDLTQLLRVPGTSNFKYEQCPTVGIRHLDERHTYSAGDLDRTLPSLPETKPTNDEASVDASGEPPVVLESEALEVWRGEKPKRKDTGEVDRSTSLIKIGRALYDAGATRHTIAQALKERDLTLGWKCYTERRDADKQYHAIVTLLEGEGRNKHTSQSRSQSLGNEVMSYDREYSITAVSFRGREKPGPREWIVDNAVCKGHPASWYGEGGIAKSLLAAHLGLHVAADGVDYWCGLRVKTMPVVYGDFELDESEHLRRAQELSAGMGLPDVPTKFNYLGLHGVPIDIAFEVAAQECGRLDAGLFILDSVGYALEGDSELAKDVLRFYREYIQPIRAAGTTPLLIDHQAKVIKGEKYADKQEFGSVYKTNTVRSSFQIRGGWDGDTLTTTFTHKKTNFGRKVDTFSLLIRFGDGCITVERTKEPVADPDHEPSKKERVFAAVEELGQATSEAVAAETGIAVQTVRNSITELERDGLLVDTGEKEGRFRVYVTHNYPT
jgi:biotin operon repressor